MKISLFLALVLCGAVPASRSRAEVSEPGQRPASAGAEKADHRGADNGKFPVLANVFFPFDSGVGRGKWTPQEQAQCVKDLRFDGIGYNYNEKKPELLDQWLAELHRRG